MVASEDVTDQIQQNITKPLVAESSLIRAEL